MATKNVIPTYDHYYTSVDVTVDLIYPATGKRVNIDKAVAIAFTHNISSVPIYTLGTLVPYFYSKGNSLVQGQLDIAFKNTEYMRKALDYLVSSNTNYKISYQGSLNRPTERDPKHTEVISYVGDYASDKLTLQELNKMSNEEYMKLQESISLQGVSMAEKSLINVPGLLNILITYNNTNSNMGGVHSSILLEGVKFVSQSSAVNSQDDSALVDRFSFMARNIK